MQTKMTLEESVEDALFLEAPDNYSPDPLTLPGPQGPQRQYHGKSYAKSSSQEGKKAVNNELCSW